MIRLEEEKDYLEVETLTREAFWNVYRPGCVEHYVLHQLRQNPCFIKELSFVLEENHQIIGHIAYAKSFIQQGQNKKEVILFGPVSILPQYQNKGYGSMLIEYSLNKAKEMNYQIVLITGNPDYYHRFGFESASKYHIYYEGLNDEECPFFMVKFLNNHHEDYAGIYSDPDCYFVEDEDVDYFDQQFPQKVKEKRPGQLFNQE